MRIKKVKIENYRLLKKLSVDLEEVLSLVIGKNNTGKTSLLVLLDKFLNGGDKNKFYFDDFNIDFKNEIKELIETPLIAEEDYIDRAIRLKLFIEYIETDNLANISKVMMDLDPDNNNVVLGFEYVLSFNSYKGLKERLVSFNEKEALKKHEDENYQIKDTFYFLKKHQAEFFKIAKKSIEFNIETQEENDENFIDLMEEKISIKDIINFKYISAKRNVSNRETDKTLSNQTSTIYKKTSASEEQNEAIEDFKEKLVETDSSLTGIYSSLFEKVVEKVKKFGGIKEGESSIVIESTLQDRELLEGNTTVMYSHHSSTLPEYNNGLGYMNLISMIFEIEIKIQEFKKTKEEKPSDINLLFIEEPEAHTHPQMQYVFIKNIKDLLEEGIKREDGDNRKLQTIISTHSSHIISESNFDDIKYLIREGINSVISKNLSELKAQYEDEPKRYQFLKQYLTLSRAEIFFADKVILIEGDTERILFPTIMKKLDLDEEKRHKAEGVKDENVPLSSQNISIIEVGAYSQIFELFIDFVGIKTLIITDIDSVDEHGKQCPVVDGVGYSNDAIDYFFQSPSLDELTGYTIENKVFSKHEDSWIQNADGLLCAVYQVEEGEVNARSFEDAFIQINRDFISENKDEFKGLKNKTLFDDEAKGSYELADRCIRKKTHFALDILYHSDEEFSNWEIPQYIKEGLLWLK